MGLLRPRGDRPGSGFGRRISPKASPPTRRLTLPLLVLRGRGAAAIAVASTATIPQLGFVHEDSGQSFVLDIADLVRHDVMLPIAFGAGQAGDARSQREGCCVSFRVSIREIQRSTYDWKDLRLRKRPNESEQYRHFVKAARELGCDESQEAFDKVLRKVASAPGAQVGAEAEEKIRQGTPSLNQAAFAGGTSASRIAIVRRWTVVEGGPNGESSAMRRLSCAAALFSASASASINFAQSTTFPFLGSYSGQSLRSRSCTKSLPSGL